MDKKKDKWYSLKNILKKYMLHYFQLKIKNDAIGAYLAKIKMVEILYYWWCGQVEKTIKYLYTKCQR